MGVLINHAISFVTSPLAVSMGLLTVGLAVAWRWRRVGLGVMGVGLVWLYVMSTGAMYLLLGLGLEREFPPARVETLPQADAIVVLGGGVGGNTNTVIYTELYGAADRVVHAARVWKAGKAPVIIPSGTNEFYAARPLLLELGVPEASILVENTSRNTEENARFVADYVKAHRIATDDNRQPTAEATTGTTDDRRPSTIPRILLVTSSWHMRRALLLFKKYAPEIEAVPAACDYEATLFKDYADLGDYILPSANSLVGTSAMLKEYIGYWGYRVLR